MELLEQFVQVDIIDSIFRLLLALLCGGVLGIERGRKKRPAGFRTYMLVSIGAALVMMTNEFISIEYSSGDPARMGAQVISGIGFLGAGTIIVTGHNQVKGLTTAAGLWASACIGLAIGVGYYAVAIISCILIFAVMSLLHSFDERVTASTKVLNIYIEFERLNNLGKFIEYLRELEIRVSDLEMVRSKASEDVGVASIMALRLRKKQAHEEILSILHEADGVMFIEEL
ncbi:MAG TPA: MgtC/SapB family protein [Clostridiales bacterium]|nr:MgtC/SapB family protein [Clostridiales bacterium]